MNIIKTNTIYDWFALKCIDFGGGVRVTQKLERVTRQYFATTSYATRGRLNSLMFNFNFEYDIIEFKKL